MRFSAIVIDDEASAHAALRTLLEAVPDVALTGAYLSAAEGAAALEKERCDLLFLDVAMPGANGLDMLRALREPPVTVLLTAYVEHALAAFELGVRDYLLKPVSPERLSRCLDNIRPLLAAARRGGPKAPARLSVKCGSSFRLIDPLAASRVEAAGNFSIIHAAGETAFASEPMKDLQQRLAPLGFVRIHKSHLVNMRFVAEVSTDSVRLSDGQTLPLGRAYRAALRDTVR